MKISTNNKISACHTLLEVEQIKCPHTVHSNVDCMIFALRLTHIDGPYLQAWLLVDISKCVFIVIIHHSGELKQTHI